MRLVANRYTPFNYLCLALLLLLQLLLLLLLSRILVQHKMRPTVSVVAWSVCVLVTTVGPAKTEEPIEIPFEEKKGPRNYVRL